MAKDFATFHQSCCQIVPLEQIASRSFVMMIVSDGLAILDYKQQSYLLLASPPILFLPLLLASNLSPLLPATIDLSSVLPEPLLKITLRCFAVIFRALILSLFGEEFILRGTAFIIIVIIVFVECKI